MGPASGGAGRGASSYFNKNSGPMGSSGGASGGLPTINNKGGIASNMGTINKNSAIGANRSK